MIECSDCNLCLVIQNIIFSNVIHIPASEKWTRWNWKKSILKWQQQDMHYHFKHQLMEEQGGKKMNFQVLLFVIQEKQKKLWHAPYYDSEIKLKQQYIKICRNLPAFGCKLYQVKELLRGNAQKKVEFRDNLPSPLDPQPFKCL